MINSAPCETGTAAAPLGQVLLGPSRSLLPALIFLSPTAYSSKPQCHAQFSTQTIGSKQVEYAAPPLCPNRNKFSLHAQLVDQPSLPFKLPAFHILNHSFKSLIPEEPSCSVGSSLLPKTELCFPLTEQMFSSQYAKQLDLEQIFFFQTE